MHKFYLFLFSFLSFNFFSDELLDAIEKSTFQVNIHDSSGYEEQIIANGSAVLINKKIDTYFFFTNAHVVLKAACLVESYASECDDGESDEWPETVDLWVTHPYLDNEYYVEDYIYWENSDFAVLKVEMPQYKKGTDLYDKNLNKIKPIKFASNYIKKIDKVYAAGYPGVLGNSEDYKEIFITSGIINSFIYSEKDLEDAGQYNVVHDAVVQPGMSGGPLVNDRGELVGINGLIEGSYTVNSNDCYFWECLFHNHDYDEVSVGKFSYAIDSDWLLWNAFSDTNRFLFEDSGMKGYLPVFNKREYQDTYNWLLEDAEYLKSDLDSFFK